MANKEAQGEHKGQPGILGSWAGRPDIDASERQETARDEPGSVRSRNSSGGEEQGDSLTAGRYSRAFENLVDDQDDVVGLLGYALYKQSIREDRSRGRPVDGSTRDPSPTTVSVFRHSADRILQEFAASAIEEARPDFERSSLASKIDAMESRITSHVDRRTSGLAAILQSVAAWFVTVILTIALLLALNTPSWYPAFMKTIGGE